MSGPFAKDAPRYWARGFSVVPLETGTKRPAKEIAGWQGYVNGPPSAEKQAQWLKTYGDRGIGLLLGTVFGEFFIGAIDVDDDAFVEVTRVILGDCPVAKLGKKGMTFFVKGRTSE